MASPGTPPGIIRFGPFELDPVNRELRKRGILVKLQPQQFAVLMMLAQRPGQIVSRDEIHQHIWGTDTFVDFERGINFSINQIRAALGDEADKPRYIETIPRRGYRFICPVELTGQVIDPAKASIQADDRSSAMPAEHSVPSTEPLDAVLETREHVVSEAKSRETPQGNGWKSRRWLSSGPAFAALLILIGVLLGTKYGVPYLHRTRPATAKGVSPLPRTIPLTNFRGVATDPEFSPDGKQIAFRWNGKDQRRSDVYVQMIGGERPLRLTWSGSSQHICCSAWSPDGQWISFVRCDNGVAAVFKVPVLGGAERRVTDVPCMETERGTPTWTLDGKSMLLGDRCVRDGPYGIVIFSFATGQKHCLIAPRSNSEWGSTFKLSPDGKMVALVEATTPGVGEIFVVPLEGGNARQLTSDGKRITAIMWAADGKRIIFSSQRGGAFSDRLWNVSLDGGDIQPETVYPNIGVVSRDGRRIAFVRIGATDQPSIWRAELSGPGGRVLSQKKIIGSAFFDGQHQLSPDRTRIVFISQRSGDTQIWSSDADGTDPVQLTSFEGENVGTPRWSPDGKWIVFDRRPGTHSQIYAIDAEGRNLHAITSGDYEHSVPSFSRDGLSIYYGSMDGEWQLWKQKLEDGSSVQITKHGGFTAFESYDRKTVYYTKREGEGIWSIPIGGGEETRVTAPPRLGDWGNWTVSENGLYVLENDILPRPTIEFYNFKTRKLTPVISLEHSGRQWNPGLDASRDGRTVLFVQWEPQASIVMVENFQ